MLLFLLRFGISFIPVIPLYLLANNLLGGDVKIFGFLSYYYLVFTLLITPVSQLLLKKEKLKKYSNKIIPYRRPLGILTGLFSIIHLIHFEENIRELWNQFYITKMSYSDFLLSEIFSTWGDNIFGMSFYAFWLGLIGFIIMISLLVTSNDFFQRIMGARFWKYFQRGVYPLFIIIVLHIYLIGGWKGLYLYPGLFLIFLRLYMWFDNNYEHKNKKRSGKGQYRKFLCLPCGYIYDEEFGDEDGGLAPGTKFEEIPNDWRCPVCGVSKKDFIPLDSHYNPKISEDHELEIILESKKYLTDDVVELIFSCEHDLDVRAGQFCNIIFRKGKVQVMRSYSVVQYIDNKFTFVIKPSKDGEGLKEINKLNIGDTIKALGPYGIFILKNTSAKKIFIATGTGLSPIYNMMLESWDREKELHFGVRNKKDLFYLEKLKNIPNLKVFTYLSGEEVDGHIHGRININTIDIGKDDEVYICGNPQLVEDITMILEKNNHKNTLYEKFV